MQFSRLIASALALAAGGLAVDFEKSILVTYERQAPRVSQMIDDAKSAIINAGGKITHEFKFINGFHAIVPEDIIGMIQEMGGEHVTIEDDAPVHINSGLL